MTKFNSPTEFANAVAPGTGSGASGGNFFKEANNLINNIKDGLKMINNIRGAPPQAQAPPARLEKGPPMLKEASSEPKKGGFDFNLVLNTLVVMGQGDKKLSELAKELGGLTVKEFRELFKNATSSIRK